MEQLKFAFFYAVSSINWIAVAAIISFTLLLGTLHLWLDKPEDMNENSNDNE